MDKRHHGLLRIVIPDIFEVEEVTEDAKEEEEVELTYYNSVSDVKGFVVKPSSPLLKLRCTGSYITSIYRPCN